jgi:thiamine pyrophosphokinase
MKEMLAVKPSAMSERRSRRGTSAPYLYDDRNILMLVAMGDDRVDHALKNLTALFQVRSEGDGHPQYESELSNSPFVCRNASSHPV